MLDCSWEGFLLWLWWRAFPPELRERTGSLLFQLESCCTLRCGRPVSLIPSHTVGYARDHWLTFFAYCFILGFWTLLFGQVYFGHYNHLLCRKSSSCEWCWVEPKLELKLINLLFCCPLQFSIQITRVHPTNLILRASTWPSSISMLCILLCVILLS